MQKSTTNSDELGSQNPLVTSQGNRHHIESTEFDFLLALYERALKAGHETERGQLQDNLHWVEVHCTPEEFNALLQRAKMEAATIWQREARPTGAEDGAP